MILLLLSVAGVVGGLMMRVRAFLFLGTAFLMLSVLTMILTASASLGDWLLYVTGICLGILILYMFALFERKRQQMLGFIEQIRHWQA
jgi:hypothetical protein